jgi:hypothetical protein
MRSYSVVYKTNCKERYEKFGNVPNSKLNSEYERYANTLHMKMKVSIPKKPM